MNVMLIVTGFLLLFGVSSFAIHQHVSLVENECRRVLGVYHLDQKEREVQAQRLYKKYARKKRSPSDQEQGGKGKQKKGERSKETRKAYKSPRKMEPLRDSEKFNLQVLRRGSLTPEQKSLLEQGIQRLLHTLYQKSSFYYTEFPSLFASQVVKVIQSDLSIVSCERLYQVIVNDFPEAYKAFHGTTVYNVEKGLGIPPFGDFFTFQPQDCVVAFPVAQEQILKALFSKELVEKIFLEEEKKWQKEGKKVALTKKELLSLGSQEGGGFSQMLLLLQFQKSIKGHSVRKIQDKETKLIRKVKVA